MGRNTSLEADMMQIQYDEFNGSSLESFWTIDTESNAVRTIANGYHKTNVTNSGGGYVFIGQEGIIEPDDGVLDIYIKVTLPNKEPQTGTGFRLSSFFDFTMLDAGADWAFLGYGYRNDLDTDVPEAGWYLEIYQDHNYPAYLSDTYINVGYGTIWLRQRYADAEGFVRQFYSTNDPEDEADWIEVTPSDAQCQMAFGVDFDVQYYDGCNVGSEPIEILLDYFRAWPPIIPSHRVRSRQLKFDDTIPVQVSDMRDGEIRVTDTEMYARVGDQILSMTFSTTLLFTTTTTTTTT